MGLSSEARRLSSIDDIKVKPSFVNPLLDLYRKYISVLCRIRVTGGWHLYL